MNELEVNTYINAAEEALIGDPDHKRWMEALYAARKSMMDEYGCNSGSLEGILFEIWNKRIGYILDHRQDISERT